MMNPTFLSVLGMTLLAGAASSVTAQERPRTEASGTVTERCARDVQGFERDIRRGAFDITAQRDGTLRARSELERLRDAARIFAVNGNEEACQLVLREMRQMWASLRVAPDNRRAELLQSVRPVGSLEQPLLADSIIGTDLRNLRDEELGEIEDVVLNADGRASYALVATGGFLGLGEDYVVVPWEHLKTTPSSTLFALDVPKATFDSAPRTARWPDRFQSAWRERADRFWAGLTAEAPAAQRP